MNDHGDTTPNTSSTPTDASPTPDPHDARRVLESFRTNIDRWRSPGDDAVFRAEVQLAAAEARLAQLHDLADAADRAATQDILPLAMQITSVRDAVSAAEAALQTEAPTEASIEAPPADVSSPTIPDWLPAEPNTTSQTISEPEPEPKSERSAHPSFEDTLEPPPEPASQDEPLIGPPAPIHVQPPKTDDTLEEEPLALDPEHADRTPPGPKIAISDVTEPDFQEPESTEPERRDPEPNASQATDIETFETEPHYSNIEATNDANALLIDALDADLHDADFHDADAAEDDPLADLATLLDPEAEAVSIELVGTIETIDATITLSDTDNDDTNATPQASEPEPSHHRLNEDMTLDEAAPEDTAHEPVDASAVNNAIEQVSAPANEPIADPEPEPTPISDALPEPTIEPTPEPEHEPTPEPESQPEPETPLETNPTPQPTSPPPSLPRDGRAITVQVGTQTLAIPLELVSEVVKPSRDTVSTIRGTLVIRIRNQVLPIVDLHAAIGEPAPDRAPIGVVVHAGDRSVALLASRVIDQRAVRTEPLEGHAHPQGPFEGVSINPDDSITLVVDVPALLDFAGPASDPALLDHMPPGT